MVEVHNPFVWRSPDWREGYEAGIAALQSDLVALRKRQQPAVMYWGDGFCVYGDDKSIAEVRRLAAAWRLYASGYRKTDAVTSQLDDKGTEK